MTARLIGIGTAVPRHSIGQGAAAEFGKAFAVDEPGTSPGDDRERVVEAIYERTGIDRRHSVLLHGSSGPPHERQSFFTGSPERGDRGPGTRRRMERYESTAPDLVERAARGSLEDAGVEPGEITHLVTVSCTGFYAPGVDAALIRRLELSPRVERTHVGFMGCHAALNGLRVAKAITEADPGARVLLCAVELCTLHLRYGWDSQRVVANALFADGAASALVAGGTAAAESGWSVADTGSYQLPDSAGDMTWRIGDHGFEMTLSARVPDLVRRHVSPWLEEWLGDRGLEVGDVASWAVHPGGPRILDAFGAAAGLADGGLATSREVLARYGNMSSATVLFILEELRRAAASVPCVALGFGPGLVAEATLFR